MVILLSACSMPHKTPDISETATSKLVNPKTSKPILITKNFNQDDPAVYFSVKITDFPAGTRLKTLWKHIDSGTEMTSEITAEGTGYKVFTLKRDSNPFPVGNYEVTVTANVDGITLEAKEDFCIIPGVEPAHLLNPVTSKSIDSEDKLNPVDTVSQFSQSDPIIYFIIGAKDLPENTRVYCSWIHIDSGETLTHEIITDGSRNIAFSLKPNGSQKLPEGKYIVTASADINNRNESVWAEFEIAK